MLKNREIQQNHIFFHVKSHLRRPSHCIIKVFTNVQRALGLTLHGSWFANISLLKSDSGFRFHSAVKKEGSTREGIQKVITSLAPAEGISMDAASIIIRKKVGIFTFKAKKGSGGFSHCKRCFCFRFTPHKNI